MHQLSQAISTCVDNIFPKCCKIFSNQTPCMNCEVRFMLHARSTAFTSGDAEAYKKARYDLRISTREAKRRQYRLKLEQRLITDLDSQHTGS